MRQFDSMYPFIRMFYGLWKTRRMPPLAPLDTHVSYHTCLPWDLDLWYELNNGRTLTLYDLGRIPLAQRAGIVPALRKNRWGLTIAGVSVRYRKRIRMMERIEMRSRMLGWDDRFVYLEQSMWKKDGTCANHALFRSAITGKDGIVSPALMAAELNIPQQSPDLPDWVQRWIDADATRPWPPGSA
jgi:acyl-CoA thioesterase FadM